MDTNKSLSLFGTFVVRGREAKGYTQRDAAPKIGISQSYLAKIELGQREIPFTLALKICSTLGLDFNEFIKSLE